jgi:hypothetical protein
MQSMELMTTPVCSARRTISSISGSSVADKKPEDASGKSCR